MPNHTYQNPEDYSKNNSLQYNFAMQVLKQIPIVKEDRILDIGCGDGIITYEMAKLANKGCVIGTDISYAMIEYAAESYAEQVNLKFLQMDACENIFQNQFDLITSFNCLHWVKDQQKALYGMVNAASEKAMIVLLLSHKKSIYHLVLDKVSINEKWKNYFKDFQSPRSFFEVEYYKKLLITANLNILEMLEEEMTYIYETKEQFKKFCYSSMAHIKQIPDDRKTEFLDDFCDEFISQNNFQINNCIPVSFWCLRIVAKKD